jgi:hypothetical protein
MLGEGVQDEIVEVGQDLGCGAGEAAFGGGVDGAAPAALVEGVDLEVVVGGEGCEEVGVGVAVVTGWGRRWLVGCRGGVMCRIAWSPLRWDRWSRPHGSQYKRTIVFGIRHNPAEQLCPLPTSSPDAMCRGSGVDPTHLNPCTKTTTPSGRPLG